MKPRLIALSACLCLGACNTTVTEILDPVTGKPTSRTTTTTVDGAAVAAGANTIAIIAAPRARIVAEK